MEVLPTSASWTRAVGLAGTPGAVRGAEHLFFFFFFALARPSLQKSVQASGKEQGT